MINLIKMVLLIKYICKEEDTSLESCPIKAQITITKMVVCLKEMMVILIKIIYNK